MKSIIIEYKFEPQQRPTQEVIRAKSFRAAMEEWCLKHGYDLRVFYTLRNGSHLVAKGAGYSGNLRIMLTAYTIRTDTIP